MILLIIAAAVAFGLAIRPAMQADREELHLFHGPASNCVECEDK